MNILIKEEGRLKGSFNGFNNLDTIFEFESGNKWQQAEIKNYPYYEYAPFAQIISKNGVDYIKVTNINLMVKVEKL